MHRRENKVLTDYRQDALTKKELADEYVTLMQFSRDYSENIMCYLLAALWYLQHLHDVPKSSRAERFAIKKIITYLLDQVLLKTRILKSTTLTRLLVLCIASTYRVLNKSTLVYYQSTKPN